MHGLVSPAPREGFEMEKEKTGERQTLVSISAKGKPLLLPKDNGGAKTQRENTQSPLGTQKSKETAKNPRNHSLITSGRPSC